MVICKKKPESARKILPFIKKFSVNPDEFLDSVSSYQSFNDFFIRRLKPESRPIAFGQQVAVAPADGRYYVFPNVDESEGFIVKGQKFNLSALLDDDRLASQYKGAGMMIARLCPSDYHRFHFPCDCLPGETRFINGWLYSVNPIALKRDIEIFTKNKRTLCELETPAFGKVLYLEIGATNVGSVKQTYKPYVQQLKGEEKGYFEFGASSLIILFPKGAIQFDDDLIQAAEQGVEMRCLMGQRMGLMPNAKNKET